MIDKKINKSQFLNFLMYRYFQCVFVSPIIFTTHLQYAKFWHVLNIWSSFKTIDKSTKMFNFFPHLNLFIFLLQFPASLMKSAFLALNPDELLENSTSLDLCFFLCLVLLLLLSAWTCLSLWPWWDFPLSFLTFMLKFSTAYDWFHEG